MTVRWDEGHAAVAPLVDRRVAQVSAGEADGSGGRTSQPDERLHELVLAVAGHAGDADDLTRPDR